MREMYRQPSKRKQLIQRVVVYGAMIAAVGILVTVLIFIMLGYQFNRSDGKIEQGGLVQFESQPSGADVTIDGTAFGTRTSAKTTMTAGEHFVAMERGGYKKWQKSIDVVAGSVLWLNYARLIPNELKPASVATLTSVSSSASSTDNKWMAIKEDPATPIIKLADISQDEVKVTTLTLPATIFTAPGAGKTQSFAIETWDPSSRYVLVKHSYDDDKTEWMVVDTRSVADTKNVTTLLGVNASKVAFSKGNSTVLYALIDHTLRRINLNDATISRPLVTNVADFSLHEQSIVAFTTLGDSTTKTRSVGLYDSGADKTRIIRSLADDGTTPLSFAIDKYFDDVYAVVAHGTTVEISKGDLFRGDFSKVPMLTPITTMTLPGNVQYLETKTRGRFIMAQVGAVYATYDLELRKMTTTTLKGSSDIVKQLDWLDNYMPWSDRDGMLRFYEFDGANQHDIMSVVPGQSVSLSPNGTYVYGISKAADGTFHLQRARLILP